MYIYIYIYIYIQARRAGSRRAPFLYSFLVHHTLVRQRGSKKWAKGIQNGPLKRRQHPELFWDAKRTPKGHQNGHPELTKAPNMAPRGAKMRLKGGQICPTNSFKARDSSRTQFMAPKGSQKGPKMDPKWSPKPHTFSNLFVHQFGTPFGTRWGPKMDPIRDTTT